MSARPPNVVTLYRRANCGLCDEAARMLERLRPALDFTIAEVSIESDPALIDRYIFAIPVVALGELEIARAPLSATRLEDALREALSLE